MNQQTRKINKRHPPRVIDAIIYKIPDNASFMVISFLAIFVSNIYIRFFMDFLK